MSFQREIDERFRRIERTLDSLKTDERGGVTGGAVPAPGVQYEHLEADAVPSWQPIVNLTLADGASIGLPGPGGRLEFDLTPAPDQLKVIDADLNFVTAAHGIIHVDGVAAGMILLADGTRYVPAAAAETLPVAPLAVGDTLIATAGPLWDILTTPGAAGYARVSTLTTEEWSQTPIWTGTGHTWTSAVNLEPVLTVENTNDDAASPFFNFYKNSDSPADGDNSGAIEFNANTSTGAKERYAYILGESLNVTNGNIGGGITLAVRMNNTDRDMLQLTGYNGVVNQGEIVLNPAGQDVDTIIEWDTGIALFIQGSDGKVLFNTDTEDANILATTKVQVIDTRLAVSQDGASNSFDMYAYGTASVPKATFKHARGTRAAPTATQNGDFMGAFDFTGYGAAFYDSGGAQVSGEASENWAVGNRGANLVFATTPSGAAAGFVRAKIQNSGELDIVEYLRHLGDTDTFWRFQTNRASLDCGGVTFLDAVSATGALTLGGSGVIVPDNYTIGLALAAAGRIEFDNQATDEINFLNCNVGFGTPTPVSLLDMYGNLRFGAASGNGRLILSRDDAGGGDYRDLSLIGNSIDLRTATADEGAVSAIRLYIEHTTGHVGIGTATPGSLTEWNFADDDLEFVDAHAATGLGAVNAVIECQIGGVTTYIPGYDSYS